MKPIKVSRTITMWNVMIWRWHDPYCCRSPNCELFQRAIGATCNLAATMVGDGGDGVAVAQ